MTAAELRKREQEAPDRYRMALTSALPGVTADVSYTDDRRAVQVVCTGARKRRFTWQFDAAELAATRDPEKYLVATVRDHWGA